LFERLLERRMVSFEDGFLQMRERELVERQDAQCSLSSIVVVESP
jgi:hypothetical protein